MVVYLDLVMGLNFLTDFLLLLGTNRLSGFPPSAGRCALGAALGGAYSGACLLPGFRFLGNLFWRAVFLGLMAAVAFGLRGSTWKRGGVFLLLSMALGGMALSVGRGDVPSLLLCAAGIWGLCRVAFGSGVGGREYLPMVLTYGERRAEMIALRDTGNCLHDPITGESVFLIGPEAACRLTGLGWEQLAAPLETLAARPIPGLRLIPYKTVGRDSGMLLGLRFRGIQLGKRTMDAVIAFSPEGLGAGEGYQALVTG